MHPPTLTKCLKSLKRRVRFRVPFIAALAGCLTSAPARPLSTFIISRELLPRSASEGLTCRVFTPSAALKRTTPHTLILTRYKRREQWRKIARALSRVFFYPVSCLQLPTNSRACQLFKNSHDIFLTWWTPPGPPYAARMYVLRNLCALQLKPRYIHNAQAIFETFRHFLTK